MTPPSSKKSSPWRTLIRQHGGRVLNFADLPSQHQAALEKYADDGDFDVDRGDYLIGEIPAPVFIARIRNIDAMADFGGFEQYMEETSSHMPSLDPAWPVLVHDEIGIEDGYNRSREYLCAGMEHIPVIDFSYEPPST